MNECHQIGFDLSFSVRRFAERRSLNIPPPPPLYRSPTLRWDSIVTSTVPMISNPDRPGSHAVILLPFPQNPPYVRRPAHKPKKLTLPWDHLAHQFVERNPHMVDDPLWLGKYGMEHGTPPLSHAFAKRQYALMQKGVCVCVLFGSFKIFLGEAEFDWITFSFWGSIFLRFDYFFVAFSCGLPMVKYPDLRHDLEAFSDVLTIARLLLEKFLRY